MTISQRPWGTYEVLLTKEVFQLKEIRVNSGQRLSYQTHKYRAEHWFITKGPALVTIDGETRTMEIGQSIDIEVGVAHRMAAPNANSVAFVEVQMGTYFGEDDIIRLEDDFGR